MTDAVPLSRDVRMFMPGVAPKFSRRRAAAAVRKTWRTYWGRQAQRATAVMLYALNDRTLKDIGIDRDEIESLVNDATSERRRPYRAW